ncbi:MAG: HAD family hydrolase [Fusobacteria bacterium]|nr:HAD family hydrolase [Fusobacteriota bacterium]
MKKLVIFDFDGTLINSIKDVGICFNKTLQYFGFDTYPVETYGKLVGGDLEIIFSKLIPQKKLIDDKNIVEKLKSKYREIYSMDPKPNTKPYQGVIDLLYKLKLNNIKIAINTNKSQLLTELICEKFFCDIQFDGIMGYDEKRPSKPDPYSVQLLMEMNEVKKNEAIYVGDGKTDLRTAENAGIECILVSWGQGDESLSQDVAVTYVANNVMEIYSLIGGK